ncbi:MAG: hypothetical protein DHS20C21_11990 [Gemmatimonadota bacterium]|nr:MAG: hypothetical protein DHS20C21_11990 [Gemmatimonadota bacterium]
MANLSELIPVILVTLGMLIPVVAIIGGITAGVIKSNARHRLLELAQRERIVALERGIDPERLPKIEYPHDPSDNGMTFEQKQIRRSELLRVWGLIVTGFGGAMFIGIGAAEGFRESAPVIMFVGVGLALLISGFMVKPPTTGLPGSGDRSDG